MHVDTGYCSAFQEIGRTLGPVDLALLPIGAYCPREIMKYDLLHFIIVVLLPDCFVTQVDLPFLGMHTLTSRSPFVSIRS